MKVNTRNTVLFALGLVITGAASAAAQARSDTRIPVRKDAPPVPVTTDTVRVMVHDTVMVRGRTDTVTRTVTLPVVHDTVTRMEVLPVHKLPGIYFSLGAGTAEPLFSYRDETDNGPDLNAALGWFPKDGNLGLRVDGNWAMFNHRCVGCADTRLISVMGDIVWRFPLDRTSKTNPVLYLLGGGGWDHYKDYIPYRNDDGKVVTAGEATQIGTALSTALGVTAANRGTGSNFWDWNAGAGADLTVAGLHWFAEARYVNIFTTNGSSRYVPAIIGLKFY
jgi:hypothetical protein